MATCTIFETEGRYDPWVSLQSIVPFAVCWYGLHAEHVLVLIYFWESVKGVINYCWKDRPEWLVEWLYTEDPTTSLVANPFLGLMGVTVGILLKFWFGSNRGDERTYVTAGKVEMVLYVLPAFLLVKDAMDYNLHYALPGAYLLLFIMTNYGYLPWQEILAAVFYVTTIFLLVTLVDTFNSFLLSILTHMSIVLTLVGFVLISGNFKYSRFLLVDAT